MKPSNLLGSGSDTRIEFGSAGRRTLDFGGAARRTVVAIAALAGLSGILAERPIVTVASRAGTIAVLGLLVIFIAERSFARGRSKSGRGPRGGSR